jgi:hypothetical protein
MSPTEVRYEPGAGSEWILAVAADRVLAVSSALSAKRRDAAWAALEARSPLTDILDRVVGGNLTGAPDFTLVGWEDDPDGGLVVHVFSRGSARVALTTASGIETIDADGVATWAERRVAGVQGVALGVGVSADASLPLAHGIVFGVGLAVGTADAAGLAATPPSPETAAPATSGVRHRERAAEDTIVAPIEATLRTPSTPEAGPTASDDGGGGGSYDHLFGVTVARPIAAAAVHLPSEEEEEAAAPGVPGDAQAPEDDASEHTIMTKDIDALRAKRRKARASSAPEPKALSHFLEASDGHREAIDGTLLLGRAPVVTRVSGGAVPRLIKVTTPNQELSRTHVEVKIEGGAVVVTDLHSKNGTLVTPPGKAAQQLRAGEPTTVIPGSTIDLGDTAVFTVGEE